MINYSINDKKSLQMFTDAYGKKIIRNIYQCTHYITLTDCVLCRTAMTYNEQTASVVLVSKSRNCFPRRV